jgi:hypothetical protein
LPFSREETGRGITTDSIVCGEIFSISLIFKHLDFYNTHLKSDAKIHAFFDKENTPLLLEVLPISFLRQKAIKAKS